MRLGGGAIILIVIVSLIFGINPLSMLGMMEGGGPVRRTAAADRRPRRRRATSSAQPRTRRSTSPAA
jgi:hypothetical protein